MTELVLKICSCRTYILDRQRQRTFGNLPFNMILSIISLFVLAN